VLGSTAFFSQFHAKYHAKAMGDYERPETGSNKILPLTCDFVAEGVGFEPTVTCATMVFETIRFGRSRIPPGEMLGDRQRLSAKKALRIAAHSCARTPPMTSVEWLRRGSAAKL
jgi:hypothetical protein